MNDSPADSRMIALGIRQPWAELILRGVKTIEVRSTGTRQRGTILIYASKKLADNAAARDAIQEHELAVELLPRGALVGTVEILDSRLAQPSDQAAACVPADFLSGQFAWKLLHAIRWAEPLAPRFLPYGTWFYPFHRLNDPLNP